MDTSIWKSLTKLGRWVAGLYGLLQAVAATRELLTRPDRDVWVEGMDSFVSLHSLYLGAATVGVVLILAGSFPIVLWTWEIPRRRDERKQNARVQEQTERNKRTSSVINTITDLKEVLRGGYSLSSSCLSMKVRSPMPCSCSCLSPTRSQRRRRELHGADSDMAQRLETAMAHTLRLGSLAELHG